MSRSPMSTPITTARWRAAQSSRGRSPTRITARANIPAATAKAMNGRSGPMIRWRSRATEPSQDAPEQTLIERYEALLVDVDHRLEVAVDRLVAIAAAGLDAGVALPVERQVEIWKA